MVAARVRADRVGALGGGLPRQVRQQGLRGERGAQGGADIRGGRPECRGQSAAGLAATASMGAGRSRSRTVRSGPRRGLVVTAHRSVRGGALASGRSGPGLVMADVRTGGGSDMTIDREDLREIYQDAGLQRYEAAAFLGRSPRQFRRWEREGAPEWAGRMLRMRAGWLDEYGWDGWRLRDGTSGLFTAARVSGPATYSLAYGFAKPVWAMLWSMDGLTRTRRRPTR